MWPVDLHPKTAPDEACRQLAVCRAAGQNNLHMAFNLSPQEFDRPELVSQIATLIKKHQIPPHLLEIKLMKTS